RVEVVEHGGIRGTQRELAGAVPHEHVERILVRDAALRGDRAPILRARRRDEHRGGEERGGEPSRVHRPPPAAPWRGAGVGRRAAAPPVTGVGVCHSSSVAGAGAICDGGTTVREPARVSTTAPSPVVSAIHVRSAERNRSAYPTPPIH